jgi:uncharacterized protein (DUF2164 family)
MQLSIYKLLSGIIYSIDEVILPGLSSTYVKTQAMAISSSLRNLSARLVALDEILRDQNCTLRDILGKLNKILASSHELLNDAPAMRLREKIEDQVAKKYSTNQPLADENYDLKSLLEEVIENLWELEDRATIRDLKDLHGQIRHFLKQEVETELGLLAPSDIARVSKG